MNASTLQELAQYCAEFLVHGVDVEGKQCGVEEALVALLGAHSPLPATYAGCVRHMRDLELVRRLGTWARAAWTSRWAVRWISLAGNCRLQMWLSGTAAVWVSSRRQQRLLLSKKQTAMIA